MNIDWIYTEDQMPVEGQKIVYFDEWTTSVGTIVFNSEQNNLYFNIKYWQPNENFIPDPEHRKNLLQIRKNMAGLKSI